MGKDVENKTNQTQDLISKECKFIENFLIGKNKKYGDSALNPMRIFSRANTIEQINVRIDDKLSRVMRGNRNKEDEDVDLDLIGYLILKRICMRKYINGKM